MVFLRYNKENDKLKWRHKSENLKSSFLHDRNPKPQLPSGLISITKGANKEFAYPCACAVWSGSAATRLPVLRVWIPPVTWRALSFGFLCVVNLRSLLRADHSSREFLLSVCVCVCVFVCVCVWYWSLDNEEVLAYWGPLRFGKNNFAFESSSIRKQCSAGAVMKYS